MEDFNLEALVNPCIIERLGELYDKDPTYKKLIMEESTIFEELSEELKKESILMKLKQYIFIMMNIVQQRMDVMN